MPWVVFPYLRIGLRFPYSAPGHIIVFCFLISFLFVGCGHIRIFKDWDIKDSTMMVTSLGLTFIDYRQTLDIAKRIDEGYYEKYNSSMLGKHPSQGRINTWFISSALTKIIVAGILEKNNGRYYKNSWTNIFNRENWLILNIGISAGMVSNNYEIGLEVNF